MDITIIGNGSQSKRILKILKKKKYKNIKLFHPRYKKNKSVSNDKNLLNSDLVFICSPNHTHYNYLKKINKNSYIFCEKPPVNKFSQIKKLKKITNKKIYFNFNERFNKTTNLIKKFKKKLGKLIYANITVGYGISSNANFYKSWKSQKNKNSLGVYEILNIHFIDLINYLFGINQINSLLYKNKKKIVTTANTKIITKNKASVGIFCSFDTPFIYEKKFIFENGLLKVKKDGIYLHYPKIAKDKKGRFIEPKLIKKIKINYYNEFNNSLEKSLEYFLGHVKNNFSFKNKEIKISYDTTKFFLKKKNLKFI